MSARFFFHGDHLAEVVLPGTPFLRPGQYRLTFLDSGQYRKYSYCIIIYIEKLSIEFALLKTLSIFDTDRCQGKLYDIDWV